MATRIPEQFIDDLMTRTDIVTLIDGFVALRKTGQNYVARCPFHDEKTPSFTVSPDKQFYHCFGCGAHGTAIGFLINHENMTFVEAVQDLALRAGMNMPQTQATQNNNDLTPSSSIITLLEKVDRYFRQQLRGHSAAKTAIDYLKSRGLSGEIATQFNIGFAPPGWDHLKSAFAHETNATQLLIDTGMIVKRDDSDHCYDRFRNRIIFPIRDQRGRVIGFGGRVIDTSQPKYLNSPESAVFHKGQELYGLYEARKANRNLSRLLVVEGYMDVIALSQFGISYAVAALGTAITPQHLKLIFRVTSDVVFCFDGDNAGRDAAIRALNQAMSAMHEGRQVRFMFLPEGEDPDSLIRQEGIEKFEQRLPDAMPLSQLFFEHLSQQVDMTNMDGRARLVKLAQPFLSNLPDGIFRHMLVTELGKMAQIDITPLQNALGNAKYAPQHTKPVKQQETGQTRSLVRHALTLLTQHPELAKDVADVSDLKDSPFPGVKLLAELLEFLKQRPHLTSGAILELWRDREEGRHLLKLAQRQLLTPQNGITTEFADALRKIKSMSLKTQATRSLEAPLEQLTKLNPQERRELTARLAANKTDTKL